MNESPSPSPLPPDDMHWGISYLREDLQDLRQDVRQDIRRLDERIERVETRLSAQIRWVFGLVVLTWISVVGMITPLLLRL